MIHCVIISMFMDRTAYLPVFCTYVTPFVFKIFSVLTVKCFKNHLCNFLFVLVLTKYKIFRYLSEEDFVLPRNVDSHCVTEPRLTTPVIYNPHKCEDFFLLFERKRSPMYFNFQTENQGLR